MKAPGDVGQSSVARPLGRRAAIVLRGNIQPVSRGHTVGGFKQASGAIEPLRIGIQPVQQSLFAIAGQCGKRDAAALVGKFLGPLPAIKGNAQGDHQGDDRSGPQARCVVS